MAGASLKHHFVEEVQGKADADGGGLILAVERADESPGSPTVVSNYDRP